MRLPLTALLIPPENGEAEAQPDLPSIVALVGAGGKTTLLYGLARLLAAAGKTVITTTTTHIYPPSPVQSPRLMVDGAPSPDAVRRALKRHRHLTLARARREDVGKLAGFAPKDIAGLAGVADVVLVEADGAAMLPLKAPAAHEPAVPPCTELCVAVLGLDGVDRPFQDAVHRAGNASALCGATPESPVLPAHLAHLALHSDGLFRTSPPCARRVVLCHKADLPGAPKTAELAAHEAWLRYPGSTATWCMGSARKKWITRLRR